MRLAIVGWRPWSVAQRYKSLMVNAKRLGHQVLGIVTEKYNSGAMIQALFRDLEIPTIRPGMSQGKTRNGLDEFGPDAVFGECFWCSPQEEAARDWAIKKGLPFFVLDHSKFIGMRGFRSFGPTGMLCGRLIGLTVNETSAKTWMEACQGLAFAVGYPNFDMDYEIDRGHIKKELGISGQPTLGVFLECELGQDLKKQQRRLTSLLAVANERGWKVFVHLHPAEQDGNAGSLKAGHPRHGFFIDLQNRGGVFVSCMPGDFNGVVFKSCGPLALIRFVDVVAGDHYSMRFGSYAVGKRYFWIGPGKMEPISSPSHLVHVGSDYEEIRVAVEEKEGRFDQNQADVKRWFYKLDGKCWQRMLNIAANFGL